MYPTTNNRRATVGGVVFAVFVAVVLYGWIFQFEAMLRMLFTTTSSHGEENDAPFLAFAITACISGWLSILIMQVIICLRLPARTHWDARWLKQDRRDLCGRLIGWVMVSTIICTYTVTFLVHWFG